MDKSIYPSDGLYYFEDGGTKLKAEVKNTPTQLRIRLVDDPPYFRDARLDRYMYRSPKKTTGVIGALTTEGLILATASRPKKKPNEL